MRAYVFGTLRSTEQARVFIPLDPERRSAMRRDRPIFGRPSRLHQFTRLVGLVLAAAVLIVVALTLVVTLVSVLS